MVKTGGGGAIADEKKPQDIHALDTASNGARGIHSSIASEVD